MRFVIFGAGRVGGYFGARLAAAGNDVAFIARGAHREAMTRRGLTVRSALGDLHIAEPAVFAGPAAVGPCDYVLLCVKMQDLAPLAESLRPLIAQDTAHHTAAVPLQNGVEAEDMLCEALGLRFVMGRRCLHLRPHRRTRRDPARRRDRAPGVRGARRTKGRVTGGALVGLHRCRNRRRCDRPDR
jgi:2-dehydropantoate 2-reductase